MKPCLVSVLFRGADDEFEYVLLYWHVVNSLALVGLIGMNKLADALLY
ncbi:hypothetical protein [Pedobacter agri]|nr:hypothetical protein [Pedobacter agri]